MVDKKQALKNAFYEAWDSNAAMLSGDLKYQAIETAMKAIVKRDYIDATPEEIAEAIKEGKAEMEKAGSDFTVQDWSMPR